MLKKQPSGKNFLQPTCFISEATFFHFRADLTGKPSVYLVKSLHFTSFHPTTKSTGDIRILSDASGFVCFQL